MITRTSEGAEMQVKRFELSAQYQAEIMKDITDAWLADLEEGETRSFAESVRAFYDNEMDDLHDSSGDPEYQEGVLERMQFCEEQLGPLLSHTHSAKAKLEEAEWAKA